MKNDSMMVHLPIFTFPHIVQLRKPDGALQNQKIKDKKSLVKGKHTDQTKRRAAIDRFACLSAGVGLSHVFFPSNSKHWSRAGYNQCKD
eukprot:UN23948